MEVENLLKLINEVSKSGLSKFEYEENGVRLVLKAEKETREVVVQPMSATESVYTETKEVVEVASKRVDGIITKAPLVGTFYAAASEGAKPFAQVGDVVKKGQVLGIIEAMKLMNEIECETDGTIEEVYIQNQEMVEYGQPLFRIV